MPEDADDDDPPTVHVQTVKELAEIMLRMIVEEEAKIERQAAETGKPVDAAFELAQDVTRRLCLRIKLHCEPGRPASHSIEYLDDLQD
jgi:hypothetical protein